ncbi:MAG: EFR1 family ferrodoxin [Oscillospiraceae bacterium]|nr:EFR1 family ferrodoxin [Oscillospiraceae bacterium]
MSGQSCIYWFSGTGNSLYAAKRISARLGNTPLVKITDEAPSGAVGGVGSKIGFVFPSYYWNLPRAVRAFIETLQINHGTYIFAVVTMGGVGSGTVYALESALKAKGLRLNYGRGIKMPDNYVLLYNPTDPKNSQAILDKNDKVIDKYCDEILSQAQIVRKLPKTLHTMYKNIERLDENFTVSGSCTGCGLCERICPVKNIRLEDGRPEWLHRCEHCVACISWCPLRAIEYGGKTRARRRYRNPRIKADELI